MSLKLYILPLLTIFTIDIYFYYGKFYYHYALTQTFVYRGDYLHGYIAEFCKAATFKGPEGV